LTADEARRAGYRHHQGKVNASGNAQLQDNWPVDITLNRTLNIDPLKGRR
jgi:translocation and assembly module TamB